ncbi:MAG: phosphatase PAP2 family protein [Candidatus Moranbacteria bacterium]|nr:phosphatase PAP2 family protein [Candidatus Moranbacteria bacterium]
MDEFEIKIVKYFNQLGSKKLDVFFGFINSIRFLAFFWTMLVILAVAKHPEITKPFLEVVAVVAILHFGITEGIIKHLLLNFIPKRKRPYIAFPETIKPIGKKFSDSSFPSSHMTTTVAMFFVITAFYPSIIILAVMAILFMAFSRLYNGMHYPSDILVGILLGLFYGWTALEILRVVF